MTDKSLAVMPANSAMPALTISESVFRYNALVEFVKTVMQKDKDYGVIPGTPKPTLLKPGAEKLCTMFGLRPVFEQVKAVEDWERGFFYYHYRCSLMRDGVIMAQGEGSCNTKEKKYRWRDAKRTCPHCGQPAIIKGKEEYGGGYLCFRKQGGCGAKFGDNDAAITGQPAGQVENTEPFDLVNTILKMAQKRALVAATLIGANASEFFTQDVEDIAVIEGEYREAQPIQAQPEAAKHANGNGHNGNGKSVRQRYAELHAQGLAIGIQAEPPEAFATDADLIAAGKALRAMIEARSKGE